MCLPGMDGKEEVCRVATLCAVWCCVCFSYCLFLVHLQPGSDSGTTAVVALIRGKQLIVANAGDSRCVVSERGESHD